VRNYKEINSTRSRKKTISKGKKSRKETPEKRSGFHKGGRELIKGRITIYSSSDGAGGRGTEESVQD